MPSYMSYLRQMKVLDAKEDEVQWITVKGNHIPIKKGQSKEDAVKSFFESKGKSSGSKSESKKEAKVSNIESMINAHADRKAYKTWEEEENFVAKELEKEGYSVSKARVREAMKNVYGEEYTESKKVDNSQKKGRVYTNTMSKIRNFKSKEEGTFDFETGKPKSYPNGYSVSFHQNEPDENGKWKSDYGRYSEKDYDKNVADLVNETGGELNIGYFAGTPEVSVWVKDFKTAVKMAKKHNQHSIWNWKRGDVWINPDYDPKKNPMKE